MAWYALRRSMLASGDNARVLSSDMYARPSHALINECGTMPPINKVQKGVSHSNKSIAFRMLKYSKSLHFFV